jgi:hypothetical protein
MKQLRNRRERRVSSAGGMQGDVNGNMASLDIGV